MLNFRLNKRGSIVGVIITLILTVTLTPATGAQSLERDFGSTPDKITEVQEQELPPDQAAQVDQGTDTNTQPPTPRDSQPPPEKITIVDEEENPSISGTSPSAMWFHFISANTFVPYDDDMTYVYNSGGCMSRTGGGNYTEHTLQLPQGAEIDYLRVYFYDNDPTHNATAYLFAYDGAGGSVSIASVSSSGTPGQTSNGSGYFSHFVDNINEALSLSLYYGGATDSSLKICGVRLRYQYTVYRGTFLPLINNK